MTNSIDPDALADHLEGVRRLARTLARDEAEADDVVQDTMVAALESRTRVRSGLRGWLSGVARNVARRKARSAGRRSRHEHEAASGAAVPSTADTIMRAAEQSRVLDLLVRMEEPYRSAVLLRYVEDLPPRVIARRMDLPVETVRTHVKRGVQRLRERLSEAHGGHAGERRAALTLAASEPLGAAHARAVALARASGLAVLLMIGGGLLWAFSGTGEEATALQVTLATDEPGPARTEAGAEQDPPSVSAHAPVPAAGDAARAAPEIVRNPQATPVPDAPGKQPAAGGPAAVKGAEGAAEPGLRGPSSLPPLPDPPPLPVAPRQAVEDDSGKKEPRKPPSKGGDLPKVETEDEEGEGEFFDGETSFSAEQVDKAIQKGRAWLLKRQGPDGSWGPITFNASYDGRQTTSEGMHAGPTALALYALLKCKVPEDHPRIRRGFAWLEKRFRKPPSSYETSMLLLAITATADKDKLLSNSRKRKVKPKLKGRYRAWARTLVDHLVEKREARGWRYNVTRGQSPAGGDEDLSSTQLAALALHAAHRLGIKVKLDVWEDILAFSMDQQEADGPAVTYKDPLDPKRTREARARGFSYIKGAQDKDEAAPRGGMTACGLANLEMARFVLSGDGNKKEKWDARPDAAAVQTALYDGLAWLDRNWSPFDDPRAERKNVYHVYWLYALERAMDLLGLNLVGGHNWYSEMGQELLNRQANNGHWDVRGSRKGHDVCDTCFALLFLKRATKDQIPMPSLTGGHAPPDDNR